MPWCLAGCKGRFRASVGWLCGWAQFLCISFCQCLHFGFNMIQHETCWLYVRIRPSTWMLLRSVRGWLPGQRPGHVFLITTQSDFSRRRRQSFVSIPTISQWTWSWLLSFKTMSSSAGNAPDGCNQWFWIWSALRPVLALVKAAALPGKDFD